MITSSPVPYQRPAHFIGKTWNGWLQFMSRHRDSNLLENHNFETARDALLALPPVPGMFTEKSIEVVHERHFTVGWVEWIAIDPVNEAAVKLATEMGDKLDNHYPILDENGYSHKAHEAACKLWADMNPRERLYIIQTKTKGSIPDSAAESSSIPDDGEDGEAIYIHLYEMATE